MAGERPRVRADRVEPYELGDGVVVWGAAFCGATAPAGVPDGFPAPSDGRTHLLALHAALTGERWADEGRHRSVTRAQLEATNVARVLLGHFHDGYDDGRICYPGSPEPLGWGERHGDHGASIVTVSSTGVTARHVPIADPPVRRAGRVGSGRGRLRRHRGAGRRRGRPRARAPACA